MVRLYSLILVLLFIGKITVDVQIRMSEFIGFNSNVAAWDQKYLNDLAK